MTQEAARLLKGPILGLRITVILGFLYLLLSIVSLFLDADWTMQGVPPEYQGLYQGFSVITILVGLGVAVFLWIAAGKTERFQSYGLALAAAILAAVPCVSPCCCIGVPIGIWMLVVLAKPEVKEAFEAGTGGDPAGGAWAE